MRSFLASTYRPNAWHLGSRRRSNRTSAAAEFDMLTQFAVREFEQVNCKYQLSVELAEQGAPISLVPKNVP